MKKLENLSVKVERVYYPPPTDDGKWYIIKTDKGIIKGTIAWRPEPNERLALTGTWSAYRGQREFRITSAMPEIPIDPHDQLVYACELTSGIGDAIRKKIWDTRGDDWKNVTESDVRELGRRGLLARFQETIKFLNTETEKTQVISWMMGHNATIRMATAAWDAWGLETIGVVKTNPYRLADLPNFGFANVENGIRQSFDIGDDDPRRIKAGILYALKLLTGTGSTAIEWTALQKESAILLGYQNYEQITQLTAEMFCDKTLVPFPDSQKIAIKKDYQNELEIFKFIVENSN